MSLPVDSQVYTDFRGLDALRSAAREDSPDALRTIAKQFESLFVQMMMKEMRDTIPQDGLFSNDQTRFYESMHDKQLAMELSKGSGLGLAEMLIRQLGGGDQAIPGDAGRGLDYYRANPVTGPRAATESGELRATADKPRWKPQSIGQFVSDLLPHARRVERQLGIPAEAMIAQAALETGWGKRVMEDGHGGSSFNLFGIKADRGWQGPSVSVPTLEFEGGAAVRKRASFRAYGSLGEAFSDYAAFLTRNPRYRTALAQGGQAGEFVRELARAGYATDPEYASKINHIMSSDRFQGALDRNAVVAETIGKT